MQDILTLTDADKAGEGRERKVYAYPGQPGRIIKVHKPTRPRMLRPMYRRFGDYRNGMVEVEEYHAVMIRAGRAPDFLPAYRGLVQTNLGVGVVYDAVRDADGRLSRPLPVYLKAQGFAPQVAAAINQLWAQVRACRCVVSDCHLSNVLAQVGAGGDVHLWIVDGLGGRTFIPVMHWSDRVYSRNIQAFHAQMLRQAAGL